MSDTGVVTLTEFLLARIAEDEALARQAIEDNGFGNGTWLVRGSDEIGYYIQDETRSGVGSDDAWLTEGEADHIACHDPNRVLAECAAKRQIIAALGDYEDGYVWATSESLRAETALCALASVYADHSDYQEKWKP